MHNEFKDTSYLQNQIAFYDKIPVSQVQAANWFQTNYLPMAQKVFQTAYKIVKKRCKLRDNMELYFTKSMNDALSLIQTLCLKNNKALISQQICNEIKGILNSDLDPLQFIKNIQANLGSVRLNIGLNIKTKYKTHSNNSKHGKPSHKSKWNENKRIPFEDLNDSNDPQKPQNCKFCRIGKCGKKWHKQFWRQKIASMISN